jgi:hypothetical protein
VPLRLPAPLVFLAAGASLAGLVAACASKPCRGGSCAGPAVTPVVLVISCDDSAVVQASLTGTCAAQGFSCQDPADAALAGCVTASFSATGPGECDAQLTFANGFVYTQSFTFSDNEAGSAVVPSPEVVPVFCAPDGGAVEGGGGDGGSD